MGDADATDLRVDPTNADQALAWDGDEGEQWARHADLYDAALRGYRAAFTGAAAVGASDRVLDVGCGAGETTLDAARAARAGSALGVDLSARLLAVARERAAGLGLRNVDFAQVDAQIHPFAPASVDVVVSRTAAMFFGDPAAAFANLGRALRPGGRLVLLVWRDAAANEWMRTLSAALAAGRPLTQPPVGRPGPFGLADPASTGDLLTSSGFAEPVLTPLDAALYFGRDVAEARQLLLGQLGWMLRGLDEQAEAAALAALDETLREHESSDGVTYGSGTWLVEAVRAG